VLRIEIEGGGIPLLTWNNW